MTSASVTFATINRLYDETRAAIRAEGAQDDRDTHQDVCRQIKLELEIALLGTDLSDVEWRTISRWIAEAK